MHIPLTIGVAGHVDHGKTTLVRALTGIDTDRKAEEKARGLSIESGVARLTLPGGQSVALIDVPGHTDYLKNTIRGLNGVDLAILVVAADDGVMPQTREHLEILKFFRASAGVVVLTKTDLVDHETAEVAELEVAELLSGTFLEQGTIFRFTHKRPELAADILKGLSDAIDSRPVKKADATFRLWIDQVRSIPGHGTVASGTVASGRIGCNDEIELLPSGARTRARSLQSHACALNQAARGQRVGINLHRIPLDQVRRGMSLCSPGALAPTWLLNAEIRILPGAQRGVKNRQRVKVYLGTSITNAMLVLMRGDRLEPGESGLVQFRLMRPVAALPQDALVISPLNVNAVIGGGHVLEIPREKFRVAKTTALLPPLSALARRDVCTYVDAMLEKTCGDLIDAKALCRKTGMPQASFERCINSRVQKGELVYIKGCGAIKERHLVALKENFGSAIQEAFMKDPLKQKASLNEVAGRLCFPVNDGLLKLVADMLCREGQLGRFDGGYRPADSDNPLEARHDPLTSSILAFMQNSGLTPVSAAFFCKQNPDLSGQTKVVRLFKYLHAQKRLVRLNDNRFLTVEAVEEIKRRVTRAITQRGFITLGDCKKLFGYGRSGGAHVLDYLNKMGFTVRREDKHYLASFLT